MKEGSLYCNVYFKKTLNVESSVSWPIPPQQELGKYGSPSPKVEDFLCSAHSAPFARVARVFIRSTLFEDPTWNESLRACSRHNSVPHLNALKRRIKY